MYYRLLWDIRAFIADKNKPANDINPIMDTLFDIICDMPIRQQCDAFSALINTILHRATTWEKLGKFACWCGFDDLRPQDFDPFLNKNGKRVMALAEQLDIKMAKFLLEKNDTQQIRSFIPQQESFSQNHKQYVYPPYYLAKMYLAVEEYDKAYSVLLPFVQKKSQDFWVWELLSETVTDENLQLAYYCKALLCKADAKMKVNLFQNAAMTFAKAKRYNDARYLIDEASRVRQTNHWALTTSLLDMMRQPWYATAKSAQDREWMMRNASIAEMNIPQHNKKTAQHKTLAETKTFQGKLHLTPQRYGFVEDIYVPAHLLGAYQNGDTISGTAIKRFDKKKKQWGFAAIRLNKQEHTNN